MPLAWDPGQVHGPLARDAEDAALMLDAIVGFSRISPISVAPPWQSALAEIDRRGIPKACASLTSPISQASESTRKSTRSAAMPAMRLRRRRRARSKISISTRRRPRAVSDLARLLDGRPAIPAARADSITSAPTLKGNVEAGLKLTSTDFAAAEQQRQEIFHRFRELFDRFDLLLTPAAPVKPFPVEKNFPDRDQRHSSSRTISTGSRRHSLVTLVSLPAATAPAGLSHDGLPVGIQIVAPRFEEPMILRVAATVRARAASAGRRSRRKQASAAVMRHALWIKDPLAILATAPSAASWCKTAASSN